MSKEQERPSITSVLEHYEVTTRGRMASCPLHPDKTPSCSIDYGRDLWRCFSCGEGGDSWDLIRQKEGLTFPEAVEWAEATLGVTASGAKPKRKTKAKPYRPRWRSSE